MYSDSSLYNTIPDGVIDSKLRIAIIMINSPNIPNYAHCATINNYLYSTKYSYDFIVERQPSNIQEKWQWDPENEYVIVWSKAEIIKKHLKNYHYVLFIDSDAFFKNFDYKIEDILVKELSQNPDKVIIFQEDKWRKDLCYGIISDEICAGLIFVKNCQKAFDILDVWIRSPYSDKNCEEFKYNHPREQGCIMYLANTYPEIKKHIFIYPAKFGMFGQYDSDWIVHLGGVDKHSRTHVIGNQCVSKFELFKVQAREDLSEN